MCAGPGEMRKGERKVAGEEKVEITELGDCGSSGSEIEIIGNRRLD